MVWSKFSDSIASSRSIIASANLGFRRFTFARFTTFERRVSVIELSELGADNSEVDSKLSPSVLFDTMDASLSLLRKSPSSSSNLLGLEADLLLCTVAFLSELLNHPLTLSQFDGFGSCYWGCLDSTIFPESERRLN